MRIDAPIFTGSFSLNGNTLQNLSAVSTTGSNTFVGNQNVQGYISASALTGSIDFTNLTNSPTLVSGSSQVIDIISSLNSATASFTPRISNLESKSASVDISISNINSVTASNIARLTNLESKSSSVDISITNINSYTSSQDTKNTTLGSYTGSNDTKWTSIGNLTGSYATTGSNTFFGTQTYSGSVYIANDLIVQGSSSIQYISASSVSIGTNIVQLNTANPSVRFAGLTIIDSGSIGGSGSFLYDSVQDEFIFVHRGNGTNVTSSHFVLGPETYDSLGNETYLTCNILSKGTGKEHLVDSCIFDNGTTTCIKNNLIGTGTITGTTIYGSTAVCSPVGKFTSCIDAGSATFSNSLTVDYAAVDVDLNVKNTQSAGAANLYLRANANGTADLRFTRNSDSSIQGRISYSFTDGSMNFRTGGNDNKLLISSTGAATFGNSLGVSGATSTNGVLEVLKASSSIAQFSLGWNASNHTDMYVDATGNFYIQPQGTTRLTISSTGAATFACGVAAASIQLSQDSNSELQLLTINNQNCKGTSSVTRMDIGNWVAQYALTIGRNGICTTGTRFGDNQANTTFIFDNAVSSCGMYIGNASSGGNLHLITGGYKRLSIDSNGVSTFACTIYAPNIQVTGQIARIDTIYLGGSLYGTGNASSACYQIESAYALASGRTSVSKGGQYAGSNYYVLLAAAQDVYVYYKLALIQSSYFCGYARFTNAQDGTNRTGISQYSFDNGGTWTTLGTTTYGAGSGTAGGGVSTPSGNYTGVVVFRAALTSGSGGTLIGIDQLHFMSCGYGMHFINTLG